MSVKGENRRRSFANSLERGVQLSQASDHHVGMRLLKERLGDPCPKGMTLSLINPCSPTSYWGKPSQPNACRPGMMTRLSTDPSDYAWESPVDNYRRNTPQIIQLYKAGFLDEEGLPIHA